MIRHQIQGDPTSMRRNHTHTYTFDLLLLLAMSNCDVYSPDLHDVRNELGRLKASQGQEDAMGEEKRNQNGREVGRLYSGSSE